MSETKLTYNTVESLPILEEVSENATLLAVVDGEFHRVPGNMVGGSSCDAIIGVTGYIGDLFENGFVDANVHFIEGAYADIIQKLDAGETVTVFMHGTYMYGDVEAYWNSSPAIIDYVPGVWLGFNFCMGGGSDSLWLWFDSEGNLDI